MSALHRLTGIAALLYAATSAGMLLVVFGLLGPSVLADPARIIEFAVSNPIPLVIQDLLKLASAIIATVLIFALYFDLKKVRPASMTIAAIAGLWSVFCLIGNAILSLYGVLYADTLARAGSDLGQQLFLLTTGLGMAAVFINGLWYILVSRAASASYHLPESWYRLGITVGTISFLPLLGILVPVLNIVWFTWLGMNLLNREKSNVAESSSDPLISG